MRLEGMWRNRTAHSLMPIIVISPSLIINQTTNSAWMDTVTSRHSVYSSHQFRITSQPFHLHSFFKSWPFFSPRVDIWKHHINHSAHAQSVQQKSNTRLCTEHVFFKPIASRLRPTNLCHITRCTPCCSSSLSEADACPRPTASFPACYITVESWEPRVLSSKNSKLRYLSLLITAFERRFLSSIYIRAKITRHICKVEIIYIAVVYSWKTVFVSFFSKPLHQSPFIVY